MADLIGNVASSITTTFKLAEFILNVQAASEEAHVFGQLIQRVRTDRAEALRERKERYETLCHQEAKQKWVNKIIADTDQALGTIGKIVENARLDGLKGRPITLQHRFEWVLKKKTDFLTKQHLLNTCHQSLLAAILYMQTLPIKPSTSSLFSPTAPPAYVEELGDETESMLQSQSARRPKKSEEYVLPDTLSFTAGDDFDPGLDLDNYTVAGPAESVAQKGAVQEHPWDQAPQSEVRGAAADAIRELGGDSQTMAAIAESLQRATSDARRRRREAIFVDDPTDSTAVSGGTSALPQDAGPRSSTLNRRRRIEAHFADS
ncbi:hypothetical protein CLAFUW4_12059 [Fulvia fulva]|uniref:Uncharacterized protein n=1 Tax=Passalora fulva TaxID=5499 RepID=A0A9Q8PES9_PASFU|nr:uncharacterized protein CLAFUR5_11098 [Fulvia fulva]KAK4617764.1 hypothetical protein CLAFUR4_12064 [Fulvia fulva]KAK4618705.1 hypothetical protein CLAFUR0_12075 [Fulvia fulva]UJO21171.1 hypothetical protein CLAFUR5_11098 [Fulvia fulva]WPV17841.1 hypothetical protein CLAFUW4_12059 [Fulvia fulva]WPV33508.1 hypothetical protein CLAFUW7_12066 [Fulvia fulva]